MEFIAHRINTLRELESVPREYGVEMDIRDFAGRLIMEHDPFKDGEDFELSLSRYRHGTMILNIKSERIEPAVLELLKKYNIRKYFFLDSSFPMIHLLTREGEKNAAIRFSEFEGLDTVMAMKGKALWVWVDCFTRLPIDRNSYGKLRGAGFKLCLVSPELQMQGEKIEEYGRFLSEQRIEFDAVCTKIHNVDRWKKSLKLL